MMSILSTCSPLQEHAPVLGEGRNQPESREEERAWRPRCRGGWVMEVVCSKQEQRISARMIRWQCQPSATDVNDDRHGERLSTGV